MPTQFAKVSPDVVTREVSGEILLVPVRGQVAQCDTIFILNPSGSVLWEHLDGTRSVSELARILGENFSGATLQQAHEDVETFLAQVDKRGLIDWEHGHE